MRKLQYLLPSVILPLLGLSWLHQNQSNIMITVPIGGNTFTSGAKGTINQQGIVNWTDKKTNFTSYVRISQPGTLKLSLHLKVPEGRSRLKITIQGESKETDIDGTAFSDHYTGEWNLKDTGYIACNIEPLSKSGTVFADISSLKMEGAAINEKTAFVKDNDGNFFYWGRRGPSVHLGYTAPADIQAEWFYNEVTVPVGQDVVGSYFMADGFAEGYFGIQVNTAIERRILFSVWSPFKTDNPGQIPEDQKIIMLKKGVTVYTGEFGNEGSGGQSYLKYMWKAGSTYRLLLHAQPEDTSHTVFTAYFFTPETNKWMLIASFKRPETNTYLKRLHSFLENFSPEQGNIQRMVLFSNQWVRDTEGRWTELNKARFTGDNTAAKSYRMDYGGGVQKGSFYLHNCGFFSDYTPLNGNYERPLSGKQPVVDLNNLP